MSGYVQSLRRAAPRPIGMRGLGEVIQWTRLGPGGFPAGSIQGLGDGEPTVGSFRQSVNVMLSKLDFIEEQINLEIDRIVVAGGTTADMDDEIVQSIKMLADFHADAEQASVGASGRLSTQSDLIEKSLNDLLTRLIQRRKNAEMGRASGAMLWGLGVAFASSAAILWLWTNRKKQKRRR